MASLLGKSRSFSSAEGDAKFGQCVKPRKSCISGFFNIFSALPSKHKNYRQKWLPKTELVVSRVEDGRGQDKKQVQKSHGIDKGSLSEADCKNAKEQHQQGSFAKIGGSHKLTRALESHGKGSSAVDEKNVSARTDVDKVERAFKFNVALPDNCSKTKKHVLYSRSSGNAMVEPSWASVDSGAFWHQSGFCEVQEQPPRLSLDGRMEDAFTEGGHSESSDDDLQPFFSAGSGHKGGGDGDASTPSFSSPSSSFRSFEYAKNSAFLKRFQDFNRGFNNATAILDQSRDTHNSFHSSLHSDGIDTIMPTQWHSIDVIADTPRFSFPLDNHYHPHHHHHHQRRRRHHHHRNHYHHNRHHHDMELESYGVKQRNPSFNYKDSLPFFKRGGDLSFDGMDARSKPISDKCFTQSLNLDSSSRSMLTESKLPYKPFNVVACLMGLDDDGKERGNHPSLSLGKSSPKTPSKEGSLFQRKSTNKKEEASWPWFEQGYSSDGYSLLSPVLMKDSLLRSKETLLIPSDFPISPSSPSATIAKHLPRRNVSEKHFMDNIRRSSSCPRRRHQERRQQQMAMAKLHSGNPSNYSTKGTIANPFEDEIEKRLRQLGLQSSQTERKTLKQILEAMHVKGLLHQLPSKKDDNSNLESNSNLDSNPNPNPKFDTNPNPNPNPSQDTVLVVPSRSSKQVMVMESVFFTPPSYSEIGDMEIEKQAVHFRLDHPAVNENSGKETKADFSSSSIVIMKPRSKVHGADWERRARVVDPLSNRVGSNSSVGSSSIKILPCHEHDGRVLKHTLVGDTSTDMMFTKSTSSDALLLPKEEMANDSVFKAQADLESGIDQAEEEVKYVICSEVVAIDHPVESSVDYHCEGQKLHPPLLKRKVEPIVSDAEIERGHQGSTELTQAMEEDRDFSLETNIKLRIGHCQDMENSCTRVLDDDEGEDGNYGSEFEYVRDIFVNSRLLRGAMVCVGGRGDDDYYNHHHQGELICPDLYLTLEKKWECAQDEALETHERANDLDFGGELYVKSLQEALQRRLLFECVAELLSKQWPPRLSKITQNILFQSSSSSSLSHITLKEIWSNLKRILPSSPIALSPPLHGKLGRDDIHTILVKDMTYWWLDPWNNMDATKSSQAFHMAKNIESSIFTDLIEEVLFDLQLH